MSTPRQYPCLQKEESSDPYVFGCRTLMWELKMRQRLPSPDKSASKRVAAKLFILQGGAKPLSSAPVWAEPSQLFLGNWPTSLIPRNSTRSHSSYALDESLECAIAAPTIFRVALETARWPKRPSRGVRAPAICGRRSTGIRKDSRRISRKVTT